MLKNKHLMDNILPILKYGCYFRLVEFEDAEFILSLRNDNKLSRHLSKTSNKLEDQIEWLKQYKKREERGEEFYVISMSEDNKIRYGLSRLYDITHDTFEYGSWLYSSDAPKDKAILGDLFCHELAFEVLNLKINTMNVRKKNKRVLAYTKSFKPTLVNENALNYYFIYDYITWDKRRKELLKFLQYSSLEYSE